MKYKSYDPNSYIASKEIKEIVEHQLLEQINRLQYFDEFGDLETRQVIFDWSDVQEEGASIEYNGIILEDVSGLVVKIGDETYEGWVEFRKSKSSKLVAYWGQLHRLGKLEADEIALYDHDEPPLFVKEKLRE